MSTPAVTKNPGGWYEIDGQESWTGSDHPDYLRALIRHAAHTSSTGRRAQAVLAYVERDTSWPVRAWRNLRARFQRSWDFPTT